MADSMSEADKIRSKRLAKLGNQAPSNTSNTSSARSSPPPANATSSTGTAEKESPTAIPQQNPFSQLNIKPSEKPKEQPTTINIRPSSARPQSKPRGPAQHSSTDNPEIWEHKTLSGIFRISLEAKVGTDGSGNYLYYASSVREELDAEGKPARLNFGNLEQAIVDSASNQGRIKPLKYLLTCWKRLTRSARTQRTNNPDPTKLGVFQEARRLCLSYCIFTVTMPDLFGQDAEATNALIPHLLADGESEEGLDYDFLQEAVARFEDDESIKDALVQAAEQLSEGLASKSMNDDFGTYVRALQSLLRFPSIVAAVSESSLFAPPDTAAQDMEKKTLLGPFFQLSPLQGEVAMNYFSAPTTRDRAYISNSQSALRLTLQQHQNDLFSIVDRFIKNKESRDKMLDWFALAVNVNHKRRAMRTDPRFVSSDGFMVNLAVCLDRLCEPFMDATFSKIDRIDADYLRRSPRVKIEDETKINADQSTSDKFYADKAGGSSNFISEIFFLTAAAHHYGTEAAQTKMSELRKQLKHMDKEIERFEGERERYLNQPAHVLALFDQRLKQFKDQRERGHCVVHATEGVLLDEVMQARAMSFMRYVIVWLMRLASGVDFPKQTLHLPLPEAQPAVFSCLPEYFLEDVVDHFKFVTSNMPHVISPTQCNELVMICITFLRSSEYIKNPGLKSGLVVILYHGVWPTRISNQGVLGSTLDTMLFARTHLLHALMKFFIECESTGANSAFYDKFNTRYEIFQVVKCIWPNEQYRNQLEKEAHHNVEFFVRFVNMVLNDATYLLDESFSAFHKINQLESEIQTPAFASLPEADQTQKKEALDEAKGKAKGYMSLTKETLAMLRTFTDALPASFTMPEVVQRLADMLDYNLDALVGPKQNSLRVQNKEEYQFDPAAMLSEIVDVYLNLSAKKAFAQAIARDGRSYRPANFAKAAGILQTKGKKSAEELARFARFTRAVEAAKAEEDAEEEDLGEIPDEFLDPLLATLMTDPVILPTSRSVVDRSTIRQMLLSDAHDPFNRAPLRLEDVLPDVELKGRIEAFVKEKRGKRGAGDGGDAMDTSQ